MKTLGKITQEDIVLVDHRISLMSKQMPIDEENPPTVTYTGFTAANPWEQQLTFSSALTSLDTASIFNSQAFSNYSSSSIDYGRAAQEQSNAMRSSINQHVGQIVQQEWEQRSRRNERTYRSALSDLFNPRPGRQNNE